MQALKRSCNSRWAAPLLQLFLQLFLQLQNLHSHRAQRFDLVVTKNTNLCKRSEAFRTTNMKDLLQGRGFLCSIGSSLNSSTLSSVFLYYTANQYNRDKPEKYAPLKPSCTKTELHRKYEIPRTGYQCQCHRPSGGERGSCWGSWLCFWKHHALLPVLPKLILCLYYPNPHSLSLEFTFLLAHFCFQRMQLPFKNSLSAFGVNDRSIEWLDLEKLPTLWWWLSEVRCDASGLVSRYLCKTFWSNLRGIFLQPHRGRYL